jgi:hypothetical protein
MTLYEFVSNIEKQLDENCNSYNNTIAILSLLSMIEERTYRDEPKTSAYAKKLIKRILGE